MAEMMTSPSSTVIVALTKSETESLVTALRRLRKIDGRIPENLEGILSRMYTYAVEVYGYGS
jgi:hypothetical protein